MKKFKGKSVQTSLLVADRSLIGNIFLKNKCLVDTCDNYVCLYVKGVNNNESNSSNRHRVHQCSFFIDFIKRVGEKR